MGDATQVRSETNRDRVRRCLFGPLAFRFPKTVPEEAQRKCLDGIADALAYMSEEQLGTLAAAVKVHGTGSARCFWPERATFIGWAHLIAPLPLEADPTLLSWFGSIEGPRAIDAGTLVETFDWFERHRLPPATDQSRRVVDTRAAENRRHLEVIADRRKFKLGIDPGDAAWEAWYLGRRAWLEDLVRSEREKRGHAP